MDFKKIAKTIAAGTFGYLESAALSTSHNKNFTREQRDELRAYSERMGACKNGIRNDDYSFLDSYDDDDDY